MILVVNPNPALDRVATVHFQPKATLRPVRFSIWPGGSGTHAGHVAHLLGCEVVVLGLAGGHTGALFREQVEAAGMIADLTEIDHETRQTFSLLDVETGNICDVAERGPEVTAEQAAQLEARAKSRIPEAEMVILSGTLPPKCPTDFPNRLIEAARAASVPCIADLAGQLLLNALPARPWLIKPSRTEVEEILGHVNVGLDETLGVARRWQAAGAENVCISLDAGGLLWVSAHGAFRIASPSVPVFNTVGSGDTLIGATAATFVTTHDLEAALCAGVAAAAANLRYDAPGYCTRADIASLIDQVKIWRIDDHYASDEALNPQDATPA